MARKWISALNFSQRSTEWVFANLRFVLFLGFLAIVYIANAHLAERNVRRIQMLQREIKELKWEYTSIKSETMYRSRQSELAKDLESAGLRLKREGPKVILDR